MTEDVPHPLPLPVVSSPNTQPPEGLDHSEDGSLDVHSCFYTIQGEGPYAGSPAVFLRLAGCNLKCPTCDTEYTQGRERLSIQQIRGRIILQEPAWRADRGYQDGGRFTRLLVITGGEPFRQDMGPFLTDLLTARDTRPWKVQIETNGTVAPVMTQKAPWGHFNLMVVCSPKTPKIDPVIADIAYHYKYVMAHDRVDPEDGLPSSVLGLTGRPYRPDPSTRPTIWLQPESSGDPDTDKKNLRACVDSCMRYGYRLSLQLHKLAGVP